MTLQLVIALIFVASMLIMSAALLWACLISRRTSRISQSAVQWHQARSKEAVERTVDRMFASLDERD